MSKITPMISIFILILVLPFKSTVIASTETSRKPASVKIGSYYADVLNGASFIYNDQAAFLLRVGWVAKKGMESQKGESFSYTFAGQSIEKAEKSSAARYENSRIWLKPTRFGMAAPDGSISRLAWKVDDVWIHLEWGRKNEGAIVGSVSSDGPIRITLEATPSWDNFVSVYRLTNDGIQGTGRRSGVGNDRTETWLLRVQQQPLARICLSYKQDVAPLVIAGQSSDAGKGTCAALVFDLKENRPLEFVAGFGELPEISSVLSTLKNAAELYTSKRVRAYGDWGNFIEPVMNQMNHSKVYNFKTGRICHTITRNWCRTDGQVLFKWDSFFNALLASLEDPEGARETIRGVLSGQQENGLIPSYNGPRWEISWDRSQPPVEAMCVWKLHQRWPDIEFLAEIYPQLVKAHQWWFKARPSNGLPYRDGNRNGLLEWGTEKAVPGLSFARYESGMDDSPMFDRVTMNKKSGTMELDAAGLSALWAMNAEYLALIADKLGKSDEAEAFRHQCKEMVDRINSLLWNEDLGIYCNRYWDPGSRKEWGKVISPQYLLTPSGEQGLRAEYFEGTKFDRLKLIKIERSIDFATGPSNEAVGKDHYTVRWTGFIKPNVTGNYRFSTISDDGVRLWVGGKVVIDNWSIHERAVDISEPVYLEAGKKVTIQLEYFQERWKSQITLGWIFGQVEPKPNLLSSRLSPTCFYPLIIGAPDQSQAKRISALLLDRNKFWGEYVCPSIPRDDPAFPEQHYWRGKIWSPTNYLMYQGLKRYLLPELRTEFARKSVSLFMKNWLTDGGCYENFLADGEGSSDPHYTWGALLCLIGVEEVCDIEPDGRVRLNGSLKENICIQNIPLGGKGIPLLSKTNRRKF